MYFNINARHIITLAAFNWQNVAQRVIFLLFLLFLLLLLFLYLSEHASKDINTVLSFYLYYSLNKKQE